MLILTRKPGESLYIDHVKVTIVEIKGHQIRIGIDAPKEIRIYREEIYLQILEENKKAAEASSVSETGLESLSAAWTNVPQDATRDEGKKLGASQGLSAFTTSIGSSKQRGVPAEDTQVVIKRKRGKKSDE